MAFFSLNAHAATNDVIARLRAPWQRVQTLSATMTRTTKPARGKSVKTLSTVYFSRPDRFHSETIKPFHRVTLADGKDLRVYIDGTPKGMLQPITNLPPAMLANVRSVPGTPESELVALEGCPAASLPKNDRYAEAYSLRNEGAEIVLELDDKERLTRMTVTSGMENRKAVFEYEDYKEVLDGVWIPRRHRSTMIVNGKETAVDILRIEDLVVNGKIPASFFNPDAFFKGVTFCADPANE